MPILVESSEYWHLTILNEFRSFDLPEFMAQMHEIGVKLALDERGDILITETKKSLSEAQMRAIERYSNEIAESLSLREQEESRSRSQPDTLQKVRSDTESSPLCIYCGAVATVGGWVATGNQLLIHGGALRGLWKPGKVPEPKGTVHPHTYCRNCWDNPQLLLQPTSAEREFLK